MASESADRRVLGAVRLLDPVTRQDVVEGMRVSSAGATWIPNRSGAWVLHARGVLPTHGRAFLAPPSAPAAGSVSLDVDVADSRSRYLPRRFKLAVPRPHALRFEAVEVLLPPAPTFPVLATWAAVRVSVQLAADADHPEPAGIEGALLRLECAELGGLRTTTLTDARGEALVVGHGIPRFAPGEGDEIVRLALDHELTLHVDLAATHPETGRRATVADPDDLWERRDALATDAATLELAAGAARHVTFSVPRP